MLACSQQPRPRRSSPRLSDRQSTYCGVHLQERPVSSFWCPSWWGLCWDWTWLPRPLALYSHESILQGGTGVTTGLCSSRRAFTRPRSTASRHRKFIVDSQTPNPIVVHTAMADYLQFSLRRAHALQVTREISILAHFLCSACTCTSESFRFITHMLQTVQ